MADAGLVKRSPWILRLPRVNFLLGENAITAIA